MNQVAEKKEGALATNLFEADVIMAALVAGASAVVSVIQNAIEDAPFAFMSKIPKG